MYTETQITLVNHQCNEKTHEKTPIKTNGKTHIKTNGKTHEKTQDTG